MPRIARLFVLVFAIIFSLGFLPFSIQAEEEYSLFISEIQTGGCSEYDEVDISKCSIEDSAEEFIELYNPQNIEIDVTNWKVQYLSSSGLTVSDMVVLNGILLPQSYMLISQERYLVDVADLFFSKSLAKTGGHVRIINADGEVVDLLGWGSAEAVGHWHKSSLIPPGYSVKRILPGDPLYGTGISYKAPTIPTDPIGGGYVANIEFPNDSGSGDTEDTHNICIGVIITEILPNPSGLDTGNEFIELYNPTSSNVSLEGCVIEMADNNKIYTFVDTEIEPEQYIAFYDYQTGLTLTNSSGGTVYLVYTDNSEQEIEYLPGLDEDVAWALDLSTNTWSITYVPTPGEKNKIVETKPCPIGQVRNIETNRCNKIAAVGAGLGPCPAGKFRNPETNRCKNILDTGSQLKPCKSGQFRNPETNRCKSLNSTSSLVPCKPGQKRNPETNRCRKVTSASQTSNDNDVKDVLSLSDSQNRSGWVLAGLSFVGASLYAVWEWRSEVSDKLASLRRLATGR